MSTILLFVGDMHLGRVPARLAQAGLVPADHSPSVAWRRVVDHAIEEKVDAVILAGDVVDQDQDRFEAYLLLESGVKRLASAKIAVLAVAGNHDHLVFPRLAARLAARLAERMPHFQLLGPGGTWQIATVAGDTPVQILGWSFPARHHRESPLDAPSLDAVLQRRAPDQVCLGILHADLNAGASLYAPVTSSALEATSVDGWFLGHIHTPSDFTGPRPIGYLGSLVGLDRSETGPRGPWRVEVNGKGAITAKQLALGPLRWEEVLVDVGDMPNDDEADDFIHARIESAFQKRRQDDIAFDDHRLQVIACSVVLVGRTLARQRVAAFITERDLSELSFSVAGQNWVAVKLIDQTKRAIDLKTLRQDTTPLGVLASLLDDMNANKPLPPELMTRIESILEPYQSGPWAVDDENLPPTKPGDTLALAAARLLDRLLDQSAQSNQSAQSSVRTDR